MVGVPRVSFALLLCFAVWESVSMDADLPAQAGEEPLGNLEIGVPVAGEPAPLVEVEAIHPFGYLGEEDPVREGRERSKPSARTVSAALTLLEEQIPDENTFGEVSGRRFKDDVRDTILSPGLLQQGHTNYCGATSAIMVMADAFPLSFAELCVHVFNTQSDIGDDFFQNHAGTWEDEMRQDRGNSVSLVVGMYLMKSYGAFYAKKVHHKPMSFFTFALPSSVASIAANMFPGDDDVDMEYQKYKLPYVNHISTARFEELKAVNGPLAENRAAALVMVHNGMNGNAGVSKSSSIMDGHWIRILRIEHEGGSANAVKIWYMDPDSLRFGARRGNEGLLTLTYESLDLFKNRLYGYVLITNMLPEH